jgi:hypothetical protein
MYICIVVVSLDLMTSEYHVFFNELYIFNSVNYDSP